MIFTAILLAGVGGVNSAGIIFVDGVSRYVIFSAQ